MSFLKPQFFGYRRMTVTLVAIPIAVLSLILISRARQARAIPNLSQDTQTIVPGIHILNGLGPSAAYVFESADGLVLFDTGLETDAAPLKTKMAELGLDWREIHAIFLTHVHGDHCGGANHLRETTGAKVYAGADDAAFLRKGGPKDAFFSTFYMPNHSPHPTKVDVDLKGDEVFTFGDVHVRAIATPGHTPGSTCYLVEKGKLRALVSGDVIMQLGDPKPVGTYSAYLAPRYRGDAKAFIPSLRKLREIPVPDLLLPGHPFSDSTPQSPCLSQKRWESLLDDGVHDMEVLLARFQADGADFLDGTPKMLLPDLYYLGDFQGVAVYGFFSASKFFLVNAPGGPGLVEFVAKGQTQLGLKPTEPAAILLTSCDVQETAGLKALIERSHAAVVVSSLGLEATMRTCPPDTRVLSAEDLPQQGWFPVTTIPLRGRGTAPIAYVLSWAGKKVLLSGRMPIMVDHDSLEGLTSDLTKSRGSEIDYLNSINRLAGINPDLWLPTTPSDGQNANLYDTEWKYIISNNYRIVYNILARSPGSPLPKFPLASLEEQSTESPSAVLR